MCAFNGFSNGGRPVNGVGWCGNPGPVTGATSDATWPALSQEGDLLAWLRYSDNTVVADGVALGGKGTSVAAGFDGTSYHVVWATDSSPKMLLEQRLTPDKTLVDPVPLPIASGVFDGFAVTCPGGTCTVGFADKDGLAAARLASGTGGVGPRIPLAQTPRNNETVPRVVAGPNRGYLAIWKDNRTSNDPLYAVRVGADGRVLDAQAIHVADRAYAFSVSATSTHYVIAVPPSNYTPDDPLRILRIDAATGELVDSPLTPSNGSSRYLPGIACGPSECLVTWYTTLPTPDGGARESAIVGRRIDAQGATIGPSSFVIGAGFGDVSVARNDAGIYLVGWQNLAARVDGATGNVLDPTPALLTAHRQRAAGGIQWHGFSRRREYRKKCRAGHGHRKCARSHGHSDPEPWRRREFDRAERKYLFPYLA
ncbi:hypothetical protein LVJ94_51270 [Pendulispora rubella]|uniref:Uncharacterized protein n=1 Tax=Pendulispora rubella TaxID=2741070 RepID=A0ABZ2L3G1_9BACT